MAFERMKEKIDDLKEHRGVGDVQNLDVQTAKFPANMFLWAAAGSVIGSATLQIMGKKTQSIFVGQWAPTFLLLGIYSKINRLAENEGM